MDISGIVNRTPQSKELHTFRGMNVQFERVGVNNSLSNAFKQLAGVADWAKGKIQEQDVDISEQLRSQFSEEEIQKGVRDGTIPAQYSPATVKGLLRGAGASAAATVASSLNLAIESKQFKTQKEMMDFKYKAGKEQREKVAQQYGFSPDNQYFIEGFAKNYDETNLQQMFSMDRVIDGEIKAQRLAQISGATAKLLDNPNWLSNKDSPKALIGNLTAQYKTGSIPDGTTYQRAILQTLDNATNNQGGYAFLLNAADENIEVNGKMVRLIDYVGASKYELLKQKAQTTEINVDAKRKEQFLLDISKAQNPNTDPNEAMSLIDKWESSINVSFQDERSNWYRDGIIKAKTHLQDQALKQAAAISKTNAAMQVDNDNYAKWVMNVIGLQKGDMGATIAGLADVKPEDAVRYARKYVTDNILNNDGKTQDDKTAEILKLIQLDPTGKGGFQKAFTEVFGVVEGKVVGAYITGQFDDKDPTFKTLQGVYTLDPSAVALVAPESAKLMATLEVAQSLNVPTETVLQGLQAQKEREKNPTIQAQVNAYWDKAVENNPELGYLPANLKTVARIIFDTSREQTGNEKFAAETVMKRVTPLVYSGNNETTYGAVPKALLTLDLTNPNSYYAGQALMDAALEEVRNKNGGSNVAMFVDGSNNIRIIPQNGGAGLTLKPTELREAYRNKMSKPEDISKAVDKLTEASKAREAYKKRASSGIMYSNL